jgi:uncharacterized lipoprotein YddW (UPF0748 family)
MDFVFSFSQQYQQYFYWIIAVVVLISGTAAAVAAGHTEVLRDYKSGRPVPYGGKLCNQSVKIPVRCSFSRIKMRGIWIATVGNIDFGKHKSSSSFIKEFNEVIMNLTRNNFNAMIFQVRPANDAFYNSKLNPWSRYLTGTEGKNIAGFDPLKYMVKTAHKYSLEYHAWLNPYRITAATPLGKDAYLRTLAPGNFARLHPDYVLEIPLNNGRRQLILDPGEPEVILFVVNTVKEIIENYDVDAIHFDDYFYPYHQIEDIDEQTFACYNPGELSLGDWRRKNVDTVVEMVHKTIKSHNRRNHKNVKFGISPFGIWANRKNHPEGSLSCGLESFSRQFADSRHWVRKGWIDYIVPQLYWDFAHETAPYAALTDWWCELAGKNGVKLYIGQGAYKLGSRGSWRNPEELANQLRYNSRHKSISGSILFSYRSVFRPKNKIMKKGMDIVLKIFCKSAEKRKNLSGKHST